MENSGGGATFTEKDLNLAKGLVGMLSNATFQLKGQQVIDGSTCMAWLVNEVIPGIEKNILEIKKVTQLKPVESIENTDVT